MIREILLTSLLSAACVAPVWGGETVTSPDGDITLTFEIQQGGYPAYYVDFKGRQVITPSRLGFDLVSESGRNTFSSQGEKAAADAL